jgi:penicillin-binding protein-related factor A (putative recombinase)
VKGGTLPFVNVGEKKKVRGSEEVEIQFKRLQKLKDWARVSGVQAGFLVEFRKVGEVYYIPAEKMWEMVQGRSNGRKSVDVKYCQENFPQVQRALIKVHHNYNITALLREILEFGGEKCAES